MNTQTNKGFTIIEVVLVLAIAALIFLMVFIALPALQANQRDTQRKSDASLVSSAVTSFTSGERDSLSGPADQATLREYVKVDELGYYDTEDAGDVFVRNPTQRGTAPSAQQVLIYPQSKCEGSSAVAGNPRQAAVLILLDDETNTYCLDAS